MSRRTTTPLQPPPLRQAQAGTVDHDEGAAELPIAGLMQMLGEWASGAGLTTTHSPHTRGVGGVGGPAKFLFIHGLIGAGKSTLCRRLQNDLGGFSGGRVQLLAEPDFVNFPISAEFSQSLQPRGNGNGNGKAAVETETGRVPAIRKALQGEGGQLNLLELLYGNPAAYAGDFQDLVMLEKLHQLDEATQRGDRGGGGGHSTLVVDTSVLSDAHVFTPALRLEGALDPLETLRIQRLFDDLVYPRFRQLAPPECTVLVYLRASPQLCLERIRRRNRPEERDADAVPLAYLELLEGYLETLFCSSGGWLQGHGYRVVELDGELDTQQQAAAWNQQVARLLHEAGLG